MVHSFYLPASGVPRWDLDIEAIRSAIASKDGLLWVSLEQPTSEEMHLYLAETFHFHPLAIEDSQSTGYQTPKVDDYEDYLFIIAHALHPDHDLTSFDTSELDCFLGCNYVVTSHMAPQMSPVQTVWKRMQRDERLTHHGADFLLHAILDSLVDEYLPLIDQLDEEIDLLEDAVIENPRQPTLTRILALKHSTVNLRRIIGPQREVMNRMSRDEYPQIDGRSRIYYRDIYDHLVRIQDLTESLRDLISDTLSTYLSATSNRLNEIMKALTIVSTIFLPLSFVAGVYGMNFRFMPEIQWKYGYLMVWGIFIAIVVTMLTYFKRRGWF
jgi:magnesium transporter